MDPTYFLILIFAPVPVMLLYALIVDSCNRKKKSNFTGDQFQSQKRPTEFTGPKNQKIDRPAAS